MVPLFCKTLEILYCCFYQSKQVMVTKKKKAKKLFLFHDTSPWDLEIGTGGYRLYSEIQTDGCSISTHMSMLTSVR